MGAFTNWPYANWHELNLDWIIGKIKEFQDELGSLEDAVEKLFELLNDLDPKIKDEVRAILNEWLNDGTLEDLINDTFFKELQYKIPSDEERESYQTMIKETLISYLKIARGSDIFEEGESPEQPGYPVCYDYQMGGGYYGLYGIGEFITDRTYDVNNVTCRAIVLDCTTFVSLILKGIKYEDSPYYLALNNLGTEQEIYNSGLENVLDTTKPWLIDMMTEPTSYKSAYIMNQSGNYLKLFETKTADNVVLNQEVLESLETGDLIYWGRSSASDLDRYNGIHHCSIFIKDLDELNNSSEIKFKPIEAGNSKYGYLIHVVSDKSEGTQYQNILTIEYLDNRINESLANNETWQTMYACKPFSNANNDSKSLAYSMLIKRESDVTKWLTLTRNTTAAKLQHKTGLFTATGVGSVGISMGIINDYDLNNYRFNGHFRPYNQSQVTRLTNLPQGEYASSYIDLFCFDFAMNGSNVGSQILIIRSSMVPRIYYRTCLNASTGEFTKWKMISSFSQSGQTSVKTVGANTSQSTTITFDQQFPIEPIITLTPRANPTDPNNANGFECTITDITTTGFKILCYNHNSNTISYRVNWKADLPSPIPTVE